MAPELSSNWKKLQARLKAESKISSDKKRKAVPSERQRNSFAKRRRLEGAPKMPEARTMESRKEDDGVERGAKSATLALWAEDNNISAKDLAEAYGGSLQGLSVQAMKEDVINGGLYEDVEIGKYVGIDCEMVGVGGEEDRSVLARVSLVNFHGTQIYDSFVKPKEFVTDWRTHVSGVSPKHMATARSLEEVQLVVGGILKDRILVGHALRNDLDALMMGHPKRDIRDTQKVPGFKKYGRSPRLQTLAKEVLGISIQAGEHSSIEDARATMLLFRRHKSAFDVDHAQRYHTAVASKKKTPQKKRKKAR